MQINKAKKIVIKLGSSTIVDSKGRFKKKWLLSLIQDIKKLRKNNQEIVIVSSGSIALGQSYLKIKNKKVKIEMSQAVASVGQIHLINEFQKLFKQSKIKIGQILITPDDTEQRRRALNARRTFENLFKLKAIPIVNENDTTATSEIKYGDNDRLAARVAQIVGADLLIILSDVDGLYKEISNKKSLIREVDVINDKVFSLVKKNINTLGSGGMLTKLEAAKICMNAGCNMIIANGKIFNPIQKIISTKLYTWFKPKISNLDARKKWIISSLFTSAKIYIDQGATKALKSGKSLLPAGIIKISGNFKKGDNILIIDDNNKDVARALSSFTSEEINKIKGLQSNQIENILGYASKSEIIHKDDIVIL
jgi:glutamate 5-kinase|tara:strand:- start:1157 stop:2254 length:1098 start_codon:yes stop_codon:yes gene_type:complete